LKKSQAAKTEKKKGVDLKSNESQKKKKKSQTQRVREIQPPEGGRGAIGGSSAGYSQRTVGWENFFCQQQKGTNAQETGTSKETCPGGRA